MPTYEYACQRCGHNFEEFQSITAEPLKKCPRCNGELQRLLGAGSGLIFKGSGFYQTDYKNSKANQQSKKAKEDKKSDNKPTKAEKKAKSEEKKNAA
jgi:putative FmdB family regulatory protein